MSKKSIIIFVVVVLIIIVGIVLATGSGNTSTIPQPQAQDNLSPVNTDTSATQSSAPVSSGTSTDVPRSKMYGMAEVATHNSASSCWSAVNGSVYDLTSWISEHPGGSKAILGICGKDGSAAFNDQHEGERRPANELAGFKIGLLGQ